MADRTLMILEILLMVLRSLVKESGLKQNLKRGFVGFVYGVINAAVRRDENWVKNAEEEESVDSSVNVKKKRITDELNSGFTKLGVGPSLAKKIKLQVSKPCGANTSGDEGSSAERFRARERTKLHFLTENRRDRKRRCPGDVDYGQSTLYLPPDKSFLPNEVQILAQKGYRGHDLEQTKFELLPCPEL